jgi:hypothetical protein
LSNPRRLRPGEATSRVDEEALWYGGALLLGLFAPYLLAGHERWELALTDVPAARRVSRAVKWGVIYACLAYAFVIDIARQPLNEGWGLTILLGATVCPALLAARVRRENAVRPVSTVVPDHGRLGSGGVRVD